MPGDLETCVLLSSCVDYAAAVFVFACARWVGRSLEALAGKLQREFDAIHGPSDAALAEVRNLDTQIALQRASLDTLYIGLALKELPCARRARSNMHVQRVRVCV
jgi:hypothetical protein